MLRFALFVMLVGCTEKDWIECADGATDDRCPDAGADARMDGDLDDADAGECTACPAERPLCDEGECVACLDDDDCDGDRSCIASECVECVVDADCTSGVCEDATCVECREHADCTDPSEAACDPSTNRCIACATSAQCAHLEGTTVCSDERCVECTTESEQATCGETSCDPATNRCTDTRRGSLGFCLACVSDSECGMTERGVYRCVPMNFDGDARDKAFCMFDFATLRDEEGEAAERCPNEQPVSMGRTSLGGVESNFCLIREEQTTCEALLARGTDVCDEEGVGDAECGVDGLDDGLCRTGGCTFECTGARDCADGVTCIEGELGEPRYCQP